MADRVLAGEVALLQSSRDYDWLGPGAYFWEGDPARAAEWAAWKVARGDYREACVVGAVIDLRNCLDLVARQNLELLAAAHAAFLEVQERAGLPVPENRSVRGEPNADRILRYLDCAVIRHLHSIIEQQPANEPRIAPFDTVRSMFTEGRRLYKGSSFRSHSHVQIAVRNDGCILGLFRPR